MGSTTVINGIASRAGAKSAVVLFARSRIGHDTSVRGKGRENGSE
jgi:hypothetical protein